jgi:hypothetical protein
MLLVLLVQVLRGVLHLATADSLPVLLPLPHRLLR